MWAALGEVLFPGSCRSTQTGTLHKNDGKLVGSCQESFPARRLLSAINWAYFDSRSTQRGINVLNWSLNYSGKQDKTASSKVFSSSRLPPWMRSPRDLHVLCHEKAMFTACVCFIMMFAHSPRQPTALSSNKYKWGCRKKENCQRLGISCALLAAAQQRRMFHWKFLCPFSSLNFRCLRIQRLRAKSTWSWVFVDTHDAER